MFESLYRPHTVSSFDVQLRVVFYTLSALASSNIILIYVLL